MFIWGKALERDCLICLLTRAATELQLGLPEHSTIIHSQGRRRVQGDAATPQKEALGGKKDFFLPCTGHHRITRQKNKRTPGTALYNNNIVEIAIKLDLYHTIFILIKHQPCSLN